MKLKKRGIKFSTLTLFAVAICNIVSAIVNKNLVNGVYPIEADSISIPILSTFISFIFLAPFAFVFSSVALSKSDEQNNCSKMWFVIKIISYLFSYFILSFAALVGALYWNSQYKYHFIISYSYISLLLLLQAFFICDLYQGYLGYKSIKLKS